jgi:putative two-component system response regulator
MLEWILEDEYTVFKAECGEQALKLLREYRNEIAVVLLDANLSDSEGVDVIAEMRSHGMLHRIPVLAICDESESDSEKERKCLEVGVSDIIYRPFDSMLVRKRVHNIFHLFEYQNELEDKVKEQTKTLKAQNRELERQRHMLKKANDDIIGILGGVVEGRDAESGEHIRRVKGFTELLARQLMQFYPEYELDEQDIEVIVSTSALHDVGKIAISDAILLKPGKLTAEEFELMKTHTVKGDAILNYLNGIWDEKWQKTAHNICRYHHERYDGRGYPDGLKGEEIPICAQIVSLADVYDALVSVRVYKRAYTKEEAFNMIMNGECGQFSPKILRSFSAVRPYFEELAESAQ